MPPIEMQAGSSFQEVVLPIVLGEREELLVGQMNGFVYRSLLRFRVPVDSLAKAAGGTVPSDFVADTVRVTLHLRTARFLENARVAVLNPTTAWQEIQTFVDTLSLVEKSIASTPISGALAQVIGDSLLQINVPVTHFRAARVKNPLAPEMDLLLGPGPAGDFLLDLVAREAVSGLVDNVPPQLEIVYQAEDTRDRFVTTPIADTYWGARVDGGPPRDLLLLSKGTFYGSILNFSLPDSIPLGATFNSARLELDIDQDRSYFKSFPFELYHVEFKPSQDDTVYTRYNTEIDLLPDVPEFIFNQALIEAWLTGAQVNQGMALRPLGSPLNMTWLVIRDARLKLVYSLPPEL